MPKTPVQNIDLAKLALQQKRFTDCEQICTSILETDPREPNALFMLGLCASQLGDLAGTASAFAAALRVTPDRLDLLTAYGAFLRETGKPQESIALLEHAVRLRPEIASSWQSLAFSQLKSGSLADARKSTQVLLTLAPEQESSWELAAAALQRDENTDAAIEIIEQGLAQLPNSPLLQYSLAQLKRENCEFSVAAVCYRRAEELGYRGADLYRNEAESLLEDGEPKKAVSAARRGLKRFPTDAQLHRTAARLHFESESQGDPVANLLDAAEKESTSSALWETAIDLLEHLRRFEDVSITLQKAFSSQCPKTPKLLSLRAINLARQGFKDAMIRDFETLLVQYPAELSPKLDFAIQLMSAGDPERAERILSSLLSIDPTNQLALAHWGSALRVLGDDREHWLTDYSKMIFSLEVPVPEEFSDTETYFAQLQTRLERLHHARSHPIDQSVVGGTQTNGHLFRFKDKIVKGLEQQIKVAVADVLRGFPQEEGHPFWRRHKRVATADQLLFSGAWSVRLRSQGFHSNHVHPMGWISSALYIALPEEIKKPKDESGYIQFGAPDAEFGLSLSARRTLRPEVGKMVLFPSYMWHGTIPFSASQHRLSVAFDIVPKN